MTRTNLCRELRCLGFDTRPVKNGVLVSMFRPFSQIELQLALDQADAGELDCNRIEGNLWLVSISSFTK